MVNQDLLQDAERTVRTWLSKDRAYFDDTSLVMINDMSMLAQLLYRNEKKMEASRMLQRAMNAAKRTHGQNHPLVAEHLVT